MPLRLADVRGMSDDGRFLAMIGPSESDRRLASEALVFQMSSDAHRRRAIDALANVDGDSVLLPSRVECYSTGESLLLVNMVDDECLSLAITAVLFDRPPCSAPRAS